MTPLADKVFGKGAAKKYRAKEAEIVSKITGISEEDLLKPFHEGNYGKHLVKQTKAAYSKSVLREILQKAKKKFRLSDTGAMKG